MDEPSVSIEILKPVVVPVPAVVLTIKLTHEQAVGLMSVMGNLTGCCSTRNVCSEIYRTLDQVGYTPKWDIFESKRNWPMKFVDTE